MTSLRQSKVGAATQLGGPSAPGLTARGRGLDHRLMLHATSMSLSSYAPGAACPSPSLALPAARCGAASSHAPQFRVRGMALRMRVLILGAIVGVMGTSRLSEGP